METGVHCSSLLDDMKTCESSVGGGAAALISSNDEEGGHAFDSSGECMDSSKTIYATC